ncbi:outer membrane protein assembly factor BamE [Testudinibacter sp. TR-2022]|uniref:outer membrane protein assembly factor BamE n=1 Tax=Testudinibacter sp. TR-2022 TaxID=2585029 RepID=UPI001119C683|nr:outer membrane protein assembly factor BamE [Testudinibacter sp. TR-2022]TNH04336.1 outer membrane protein assembly factor BamE [Pasteurellaceae bacterium Phil31]TNH07094.1 outer membrane protein assembly factor BamE [Testudinibacter sp. TR-2022]TNH10883.1 outer membrane protein assembly factor BamE [Testudinibacter sp. TR-2022]TNH12333.1 outer membrane protein assembly factor BamE [Testudinibacter sp. TR-2022]TNH19092.1 outer membrane protein assembly factor BamE [Testudinibacter sp. TR-20
MRLKSVLVILLISISATSCSLYNKLVYRIDVPQGNYLQAEQVAQLQNGMTPEQVQYLLGTPMLTDPYSSYTWYYVYLQQKGYEDPEQYTLTVNFNQKGTVSDFNLDRPLPQQQDADIKPLELEDNKSWWQSMKDFFSFS